MNKTLSTVMGLGLLLTLESHGVNASAGEPAPAIQADFSNLLKFSNEKGAEIDTEFIDWMSNWQSNEGGGLNNMIGSIINKYDNPMHTRIMEALLTNIAKKYMDKNWRFDL